MKGRTGLDSRPVVIPMGDTEIVEQGAVRFDLRDPYSLAVGLTWPSFLLLLLALLIVVNVGFALLYWAVPGSVASSDRSLLDAFFFSVETLATVGYGEMYPATFYGHAVSVAEIFTGMALTAILTGLVFVRFSRPRASFRYADNVAIGMHRGRRTLMLRVANGRVRMLQDATARLNLVLDMPRENGAVVRTITDLPLSRSSLPLFAMTWTLMHEIDEDSPLHELGEGAPEALGLRLILSLQAYDPSANATVHDVRQYRPSDVRFGVRFGDTVTRQEDGRIRVDLGRLSVLEPDGGAEHQTYEWAAERAGK